MAKMLILEAKKSGEKFRLVAGAIKSDVDIPAETRAIKIQKRLSDTLLKVENYMKDNVGEEIVVKGMGFVD